MSGSSENVSDDSAGKSHNRSVSDELSDMNLSENAGPTYYKDRDDKKRGEKKGNRIEEEKLQLSTVHNGEEAKGDHLQVADSHANGENNMNGDAHTNQNEGGLKPMTEEEKETEERMKRNQTILLKLMNNSDEPDIHMQANDEQELFKHLTNRLNAMPERNLEDQKEKENSNMSHDKHSDTSRAIFSRAQTYIQGRIIIS